MLGRPVEQLQFDANDVERARTLGAAHGEGWTAIIVGADVAADLAADYLARGVKELRQRARAERSLARDTGQQPTGTVDEHPADTHGAEERVGAEAGAEAVRRVEREAERETRERATRFNLELGRSVYSTLSRVRVDENVLRVLASVGIVGDLGDVAVRGARYGFPGWVTESRQKNGKTKYGYLEKPDAERRASDYLSGATKPGDITGRQIALLAMATLADQDAVAVSNRSWHHIKANGPWAAEVDELLDKLVAENLPGSALTLLGPVLERRRQEQQERSAARRAREEASARLEGVVDRIGELSVEQIDQAERDLDNAWAGWTPRYSTLRGLLAARRQQLTQTSDDNAKEAVEQAQER